MSIYSPRFAVQFESLSVGDIIVYQAFGGEDRRIVIDYLDEDIKNDRSGFSGRILDQDDRLIPNDKTVTFDDRPHVHVWGYSSQITFHTGRKFISE